MQRVCRVLRIHISQLLAIGTTYTFLKTFHYCMWSGSIVDMETDAISSSSLCLIPCLSKALHIEEL